MNLNSFSLPGYRRSGVLKCALTFLALFVWCFAVNSLRAQGPPLLPALSDTTALHHMLDSLWQWGHALDSTQQAMTAKPGVRGVRATGGVSRGVVAGGWANLELTRSFPPNTEDPRVILTRLGDNGEMQVGQDFPAAVQKIIDSIMVISVPDSLPRGNYQVRAFVSGLDSILQRPQILHVEPLFNIILWSLLPIALLTLFLVVVTRRPSATGVKGLRLLFLEPQNMTYSLSRAQFLLWSVSIAWGYMFLFFARGLVEDIWTFPPLTGFIYTFLISLSTLIGAQVTTAAKGAKGSGSLHPSLADLIVHGGVPALERVQQILWTLIAIGIFLGSIVKNYALATGLPEIPEELLVLMGISSAGYLAGKAARKPGPIIQQVRVASGSLQMNITGEHMSREAVLWIDTVQRMEKPTVVAADQQTPMEFAKELQFKFEDMNEPEWLANGHIMLIVNADGQRCEWHTTPAIRKVTESSPDEQGKVTLTIETEYVPAESVINVVGATKESATRNTEAPNIWSVVITPANSAAKPYDKIQIPYGKNQLVEYSWRPAMPAADKPAEEGEGGAGG